MKITSSRRYRAAVLAIEFVLVTALCALWLLIFFGLIYLFMLAAVYW